MSSEPHSNDFIGAHVCTRDAGRVREAIASLFTAQGFALLSDLPASVTVDDEDALPDGDDWCGVMVSGPATDGPATSGPAGTDWVSVWVADWQDSGALARHLSAALSVPVLELWVAEDTGWGYTFFLNGQVADRFAADPAALADTPGEAALYAGRPDALLPVLRVPLSQLETSLRQARANAGQFAGIPVDALAGAVGLPFEHAFTGYDAFFDDDPEDYAPALENWSAFRHLAFRFPPGRAHLAE